MMTLRSATLTLDRPSVRQHAMDYLALGKPRVVVMILAVTMAGFYMGAGQAPDWLLLLHVLIGVALSAGGTLALNQFMERHEDGLMERTQGRPLPEGRILPISALMSGCISVVAGLSYLLVAVNFLAAAVTATTTITYLFWYTPLKRKSAFCSIVGAIPGALPPVTGWVAARGSWGQEAWILFAMMFLWQLPHALAIALLYCEDYARAGFQLLPVLQPDGRSTGRQIVTNCLALFGVALLPTLIGMAGPIYFIVMCIIGLGFLGFGLETALTRTQESARRLVLASLVYLPLMFLVMMFDKAPVG
jgi:protoheme IX farnesyltransferase